MSRSRQIAKRNNASHAQFAWYYDMSGHYDYLMLPDLGEAVVKTFFARMRAAGFACLKHGQSRRRADNGCQFAWYIRLSKQTHHSGVFGFILNLANELLRHRQGSETTVLMRLARTPVVPACVNSRKSRTVHTARANKEAAQEVARLRAELLAAQRMFIERGERFRNVVAALNSRIEAQQELIERGIAEHCSKHEAEEDAALHLKQSEIDEALFKLDLKSREYEELFSLWERTDAARRDLALARHSQSENEPTKEPS